MDGKPLSMAFKWRGGAFHPVARFLGQACETFVPDATYWLNVEAERTERSHDHQFAWVAEAWKSLPENLADDYPTAEHLRKRALVAAGYFDEQAIDAGNNTAALRVAQGIRSFPGESFSLVIVRGPFVIVRRPKSQSHRAMGGKVFQESKTAILGVIADLLGVEPEALNRQREAA